MPIRNAKARWEGGLPEGRGSLSLGSGAFEGQYSYGSRFEEAPCLLASFPPGQATQ